MVAGQPFAGDPNLDRSLEMDKAVHAQILSALSGPMSEMISSSSPSIGATMREHIKDDADTRHWPMHSVRDVLRSQHGIRNQQGSTDWETMLACLCARAGWQQSCGRCAGSTDVVCGGQPLARHWLQRRRRHLSQLRRRLQQTPITLHRRRQLRQRHRHRQRCQRLRSGAWQEWFRGKWGLRTPTRER